MREHPQAQIIVNNLSFDYGLTKIFHDISLEIKRGEFLGIIGPNGGGKTTLLRLLMGFLKPQSGSILIDGKEPQAEQNKIAYVPQNLRFDKQFPISVREVVLSGRLSHLSWLGRYSKIDHEAANEAMKLVDVEDLHSRAFGDLSGGQMQRVLIARALASKPEILFLDEPTASVDARAEEEIYRLLKSFSSHMTVVMVTHDLKAAIELVDRVLCVQGGVVSLLPEQVCEHFALGLYHPPLIQLEERK